MSTAPPLLKVEHVTKSHGTATARVPALRGVDLSVDRGELVAVTGPSGAGKSTLLHVLAGLLRPDSGCLHLDGRQVGRLDEGSWAALRRHRFGIVFQSGNLLADLTVAANVQLPALLAGARPRIARARARELLERLDLASKAHCTPAELSGGEQQRAGLARALANNPDILLADEPTGSLDSRGAREVLALLAQQHEQGRAIVVVTHDARVAAIADRVISLFDGQVTGETVLAAGSPDEARAGARSVWELGE